MKERRCRSGECTSAKNEAEIGITQQGVEGVLFRQLAVLWDLIKAIRSSRPHGARSGIQLTGNFIFL